MDNNGTANRGQLAQVLELERALARQRRQHRWQQLPWYGERLQAYLTQPWPWRWWWWRPRLAPHS